MIKRIYILTFLLFACSSAALFASRHSGPEAEYYRILDAWINNEIRADAILGEISELERDLSQKGENLETLYWESRISFLKAQVYYDQKEKKLSIGELESCLDSARKANEIQESGDVLGVMAEANSLMMLQKDFFYIVANYKLPTQQARRALELDPDNPKASFVLAQFLCNAPPIAGGDPDEGLRIFRDLAGRKELRKSDRFFALQSLAEVYKNNKREDEASDACRKALEIFPGNIKCTELLSEAGG